MTKLNALAITSPGSRPLKNTRQERYCRSRAAAQPRIPAYREAGWETSDDDDVYRKACRLERRREINDRIAYLTRQAEDRIAEKRARIEERLWAIHEADLADYFETYQAIERDHNGRPVPINPDDPKSPLSTEVRERPKLLGDLSPAARKVIEDITIDSKGRLIPKLYSKLQANKELRAMLNISAKEAPRDVTQLSDAELIQTLAQQAKELGIQIDLNYTFHKPNNGNETDNR
jgi:hypothetical protein